jgi:hypothetical protein
LFAEFPVIPLYGRGKSTAFYSAKRVAGATTARETLLEKLRFRYFSAGFTPQTWHSRAP